MIKAGLEGAVGWIIFQIFVSSNSRKNVLPSSIDLELGYVTCFLFQI